MNPDDALMPRLPIGDWIDAGIDWLKDNVSWLFDQIGRASCRERV